MTPMITQMIAQANERARREPIPTDDLADALAFELFLSVLRQPAPLRICDDRGRVFRLIQEDAPTTNGGLFQQERGRDRVWMSEGCMTWLREGKGVAIDRSGPRQNSKVITRTYRVVSE